MTILVFIVLICASAFFSSGETAYFSLHQGRVRLMQSKKLRNAKLVAHLKADPERLLVTILIGNNLVNIFMASLATVVAAEYFASGAVGIATGVTTLIILLFGEIVPKSFAITYAEFIARLFAKPLLILSWFLYPLTATFMWFTAQMNKLFGNTRRQSGVTEDEVRIMTRMGVESGAIEYREREMIENVFRFDDIPVDTVMTPLYKVEFLNGTVPIDQIAHFASQSRFSRFPVSKDEDIDHIIGYIHVNRIMQVLNSDERDRPVADFVDQLAVVDETEKIERVFRSMQREHEHMYLVHRENDKSDIIGVVTLENLLEEIVGEINDEADAKLRRKHKGIRHTYHNQGKEKGKKQKNQKFEYPLSRRRTGRRI